MATLNFKRFSHVDDLKAIHLDSLIRFLEPHAAYFAAKGFILPSEDSPDDFDYEALTSLFISTDDMPPDLVEALYQVHEMATPEGLCYHPNKSGLKITHFTRDFDRLLTMVKQIIL